MSMPMPNAFVAVMMLKDEEMSVALGGLVVPLASPSAVVVGAGAAEVLAWTN